MDNTFDESESLYRAVYPPEVNRIYWKDENHISSAVFLDKKGVSVERGNYRSDDLVVQDMKKSFVGKIISVTVGVCVKVNAKIFYKPTKRSIYHSEIHGSETRKLLTASQRRFLSINSRIIKTEA